MSPGEKRVVSWRAANGDRTLRLDYENLTPDSVVFDVGGYEGQWASDIYSRYCCHVCVFEPVDEYFEKIQHRFSKNSKIQVFNFGLASADNEATISVAADASSVFKTGGNLQQIILRDAVRWIKKNNILRIALIKMNIEGGEYDLLPHLINSGYIRFIDNLQIQFHAFPVDAVPKMNNIQEELRKTHELTYQYPFVWENWTIKKTSHR